MNIYVGNLSPEVKEEDLNELFSQHGKVSSAKVIRDMFTQESRGFGFVEMPAQAEAMKAIETLNTFDLKGKKIVVNEARPPRDRRGGGRAAHRCGFFILLLFLRNLSLCINPFVCQASFLLYHFVLFFLKDPGPRRQQLLFQYLADILLQYHLLKMENQRE